MSGSAPSAALSPAQATELLWKAASGGGHEQVAALLDQGGDPREPIFPLGQAAIHWIVRRGSLARAEPSLGAILSRFPDAAQSRDSLGQTPLLLAARLGALDLVQALLPLSDAGARDSLGQGAALLATCDSEEDVCHMDVAMAVVDHLASSGRAWEAHAQCSEVLGAVCARLARGEPSLELLLAPLRRKIEACAIDASSLPAPRASARSSAL